MPDVSRSDSQRSDTSRPRVSFNRDVHVKRIGKSAAPRVVGALAGDASGRLQPLSVRRERPTRLSRRDLAAEAHKVLVQADSVRCRSHTLGLPPVGDPNKYHSLPARRKKPRPSLLQPSGGTSSSSLDGERVKRPRVLARSASDAAAATADPPTSRRFWSLDRKPDRNRKPRATSILNKKSLSDSEKRIRKYSDSEASTAKKKQLSPIIEASPRDDYFQGPGDDALDADMKGNTQILTDPVEGLPKAPHRVRKGMPRGPAVHTLVRKLSEEGVGGRGPPRVVSPLVAVSPSDDRHHNNNLPFSYTDRLLPTHTDHAASPTPVAVQGDAHNIIYAEVVCNGGGKGGPLTKQTVHTSVPVGKVKEDALMGEFRSELHTSLADYNVRDANRKEFVTEDRGRADGMDSRRNVFEEESYRRMSPVRRNLMDDFLNGEGGQGYAISKFNDDMIEPVLKPRNDLSSRRDRLESRIESQRKDRLLSSRLNANTHSRRHVSDAIVVDNVKKYPSNPRLDSDVTRRDFLNSQINYENGLGRDVGFDDNPKFYADFGRSVDHIDKFAVTKNDKFDSGIDIDFRGDTVNSYQNNRLEVQRSYHNKYEKKSDSGGRIRFNSQPTLTNITKVDVNGHIQDDVSDDDEMEGNHYYKGGPVKPNRSMQSTKLVSESRRDVLPTSSVLIRNLHESGVKKRDSSVEETRRFLAEERRQSAAEKVYKWSDRIVDAVRPPKKKLGAMDKVRALFTPKKKVMTTTVSAAAAARQEGVASDPLTSRYSEYRGGRDGVERMAATPPRPPSRVKSTSGQSYMELAGRRERLATPSPAPGPRPSPATAGWFKSLDRLTSRKKHKPKLGEPISESEDLHALKPPNNINHNNNNTIDRRSKNLRFFGDTDAESVRSGATREQHKAEAVARPAPRRYKTGNKLQVPRRRHHRSAGELATSSAESTTEGDSSQQSQRSVVYLHAATVGDIPGRTAPRSRARSREELSSTTGSNLGPSTRTVSRSISVLAPWKPRHYREPLEVHYESESAGKPPRAPVKENRKALLVSTKSVAEGTLRKEKKDGGQKRKELARSVSMPKDSTVKSGWFRMRKRT